MVKYSRRHFIKAAGVGAAAIALSQCDFESFANKERPNIIFMMSDDHAVPAISSYNGFLSEVFKHLI